MNAIASLRPRDESAAALSAAIAALAEERQRAELRRSAAACSRVAALRDPAGSIQAVEAAEREISHSRIESDRLKALEADLVQRLDMALKREALAKSREAVDAARFGFTEAAATFAKALPGYAKAATTIVRLAEFADAQDAALARFRAAVRELGDRHGEHVSHNAPVDVADASFLKAVVLPSPERNTAPLLGKPPPVPVFHPYANRPTGFG